MAGSAGDCVVGFVVAELRKIFGIDVVGHSNLDASLVLDGICIGGEVVALGFGVAGVAELAFVSQVSFVLAHELDEVVAGDVLGQGLDVGRFGARSSGWSRCLRCWSCRGGLLRKDERRGEKDDTYCDERRATNAESIHSGQYPFVSKCGACRSERDSKRDYGKFSSQPGGLNR